MQEYQSSKDQTKQPVPTIAIMERPHLFSFRIQRSKLIISSSNRQHPRDTETFRKEDGEKLQEKGKKWMAFSLKPKGREKRARFTISLPGLVQLRKNNNMNHFVQALAAFVVMVSIKCWSGKRSCANYVRCSQLAAALRVHNKWRARRQDRAEHVDDTSSSSSLDYTALVAALGPAAIITHTIAMMHLSSYRF